MINVPLFVISKGAASEALLVIAENVASPRGSLLVRAGLASMVTEPESAINVMGLAERQRPSP